MVPVTFDDIVTFCVAFHAYVASNIYAKAVVFHRTAMKLAVSFFTYNASLDGPLIIFQAIHACRGTAGFALDARNAIVAEGPIATLTEYICITAFALVLVTNIAPVFLFAQETRCFMAFAACAHSSSTSRATLQFATGAEPYPSSFTAAEMLLTVMASKVLHTIILILRQ